MSRSTLGFLFSGFVWLVLGVLSGVAMAGNGRLRGEWGDAHAHASLIGFVIFAIYGVGYHVLPRFSGRPLYRESWAWFQLWLGNLALVGMVVGFILLRQGREQGPLVLGFFGGLQAIAALIFIANLLKTMLPLAAPGAPPPPPPRRQPASS